MFNIYDLTYFELRSEIRNGNYRFCRYDGKNYDELSSYITEISPRTKIWDRNSLKKGKYYTFSGRTRAMQEVHLWELRACIASNPYLVLDGSTYPLAQSKETAMEYLSQNPHNRVFAYEALLDTFSYDPYTHKYILFNIEHRKGLSFDILPDYREWYFSRDDQIYNLFENIEANYTLSLHLVTIDFGLREKADRVIDLIYEINKNMYLGNRKKCIFNPSWEDASRYRKLYGPCLKEHQFKDFISVLYNYVFEETKSKNESGRAVNRELLPDNFKNDRFVIHVNELRNHYFHGIAEYITNNTSVDEIFQYYLENPMPRSETDYETLQTKLLDEFINFLNRLNEFCVVSSVVEGIICLDERNNVYCGSVLLPRELDVWVGCRVVVKNKMRNELSPLNRQYPFYSQFPIIFDDQKDNITKVDIAGESIFCCGEIYLGKNLSVFENCIAEVKSFTPVSKTACLYEFYKLRALEVDIIMECGCKCVDSVELSYKSLDVFTPELMKQLEYIDLSKIKLFHLKAIDGVLRVISVESEDTNKHQKRFESEGSLGMSQDSHRVPTRRGRIERDSNNVYHVGNVKLARRFAEPNEGKLCEVIDASPNTVDASYPFISFKVKLKS